MLMRPYRYRHPCPLFDLELTSSTSNDDVHDAVGVQVGLEARDSAPRARRVRRGHRRPVGEGVRLILRRAPLAAQNQVGTGQAIRLPAPPRRPGPRLDQVGRVSL